MSLAMMRDPVFRVVTGLLVVMMGVGIAALSIADARAQAYVARLSVHWSPTHHSAIYAKKFTDEVNRRAAGRLRIDYFDSGQLFGIREQLGAVTSGAVEIGGIVPIVSFPPINRDYTVIAYPGLFDSYAQQRRFFFEAEAGREIWADITRKSNTKLLMFDPVGPVMTFSTARELDSVEAMAGLKARALIRSERPMWEAYGANITSLATREVYTALQTGMIDSLNAPPGSIKAYSWWEYLAYAQLPYQYFADAYLMANKTWFESLPADLQQLLIEVGDEIGKASTDQIMQVGERTLREFKQRGGIVTVLQGRQKAAFDALLEEKVKPGMAKLIDPSVMTAAQAFVAAQ